LPVGYYAGVFENEGNISHLWTSVERDSSKAYNVGLLCGSDGVSLAYYNEGLGFSVRCIKD